MQYNYNTQGITRSSGTDPRNLGGSEGYGNKSSSSSSPTRGDRPKSSSRSKGSSGADPRNLGGSEGYGNKSSSSSTMMEGLMSNTSKSSNNDTNDEPSFFENIANLFSSNGGNLPDSNSNDDYNSGMSLYSGPMFTTSEDIPSEVQDYLDKASVNARDSAMYEALGVATPDIYLGKMPEEEEPDPITIQPSGEEVPSIEEAWGLRPRNPAELATSAIGKILGKQPKTVDGIEEKSELEYFLDAQPETELYDFFKYVPDAYQISNYLEGRKLRKQGLDITVEEIDVKAGDTLSAIAKDKGAPAPVSEDPDRQFYQSGVPIEDRVFEGTPPAAADAGLMSDPRKLGGAEGYGNPVGDLSIFSKPVDNIYTEFKDIEGEEAHLGGADYKQVGITLPLGIVATSGLKYTHNGKTIDLPDKESKRWGVLSKAGVTTGNFDPSNVITDDAVKDGIKRSDYLNDENWTKAVIKSFEKSAVAEIKAEGVDTSKLDDKVIEGIASLAWNAQGHKWKDIEAAYPELVKTNPDMSKVQTGMLQVFTANKIVIRGLADRRAKDYNKVAEGLDQPTITAYTPKKLTNGNAGIEYKLSDGTSITRDTGRDYATQASKASFKDFLDTEVTL